VEKLGSAPVAPAVVPAIALSTVAVLSLVCVLTASPARAVVIAADDFESYPAGSQLEDGANGSPGTGQNGGTGWTGPYNIDDARKTNATVAAITGLGGANAALVAGPADTANLISRPFPAQTGTVYFAFKLRTTAGSITNEDFVQFGLSDVATGEPKGSIGTAGTAAGTVPMQFFARVPQAGASGFSGAGNTLAADTTYLLVGKAFKTGASANYNRLDLFLNPADSIEPATPTATSTSSGAAGAATFSNLILRTFRHDASDQYYLDDFVIGTTYADVVPEPASSAVAAAAACGLLLRRRATRRTPR
jgi:hypothetical protein